MHGQANIKFTRCSTTSIFFLLRAKMLTVYLISETADAPIIRPPPFYSKLNLINEFVRLL
jgi:hypothetical protein